MVEFYLLTFHAFRYERKNTNPTLVRIELTTFALTSRCTDYLLDHSGDEGCIYICMYVCMVVTYSRVWINQQVR